MKKYLIFLIISSLITSCHCYKDSINTNISNKEIQRNPGLYIIVEDLQNKLIDNSKVIYTSDKEEDIPIDFEIRIPKGISNVSRSNNFYFLEYGSQEFYIHSFILGETRKEVFLELNNAILDSLIIEPKFDQRHLKQNRINLYIVKYNLQYFLINIKPKKLPKFINSINSFKVWSN